MVYKPFTPKIREEIRRTLRPPEPDVRAALRRHVRRGWVCADVGANVGVHTVLLAHRVGRGGHVFAFEPYPPNADLLEERIVRRRLGRRVTVVRAAVADEPGPATLYPGRNNWAAEWSLDPDASNRAGADAVPVTVNAVTLDDVVEHLDLAKIDTEGTEAKVLAGMRRLLRESRPVLVIETHGDEARASVAEILDDAGYRAQDVHGRPLGAGLAYHVCAVPR